MISMKILFHVWNLILFKGQKYQGPWLFLFLYSKTSVQNSFVQCPIVFVCDLWPDLWPVTCTLAPPAERGHADMSQDWLACFQ